MRLVKFVRAVKPGGPIRHVWINPEAVESAFSLEEKDGPVTRIITLAARDGEDQSYWDVAGELDDVAMQLKGLAP